MFGALEALIGVHKPNYFTDILRKIVCMRKQCVPGRIFRPGNEATMYLVSFPDVMRSRIRITSCKIGLCFGLY